MLMRSITSADNAELALKSLAASIQRDIDQLRPTNAFVDSSIATELSEDDAYKIQAHTRQFNYCFFENKHVERAP